MVPTVTFFLSLTGLLTLFGLKLLELKRGVKPFSVFHYKADMVLRKHAASIRGNLRYVNPETIRLLALFLFAKVSLFVKTLIAKIEQSEFFKMIHGKTVAKSSGVVSAFLKKLAPNKDDEHEHHE